MQYVYDIFIKTITIMTCRSDKTEDISNFNFNSLILSYGFKNILYIM